MGTTRREERPAPTPGETSTCSGAHRLALSGKLAFRLPEVSCRSEVRARVHRLLLGAMTDWTGRAVQKPLTRVAWQGPVSADGGGVAHVGLQLVQGLRRHGVAVDCYMTGNAEDFPEALREDNGIRLYSCPTHWKWHRWYSRNPLTAFITGQTARGVAQCSLARMMAAQHARQPYDLLYQYSQIELFGVRARKRALPPIVVHPEVHAAGELAWHRRERALAARCESPQRRLTARAMLVARAVRQRRDIRLVRRVIVPSRVFGCHIAADYGVPLDRISVVPNPIDLTQVRPPSRYLPKRLAATAAIALRLATGREERARPRGRPDASAE